MQNGGPGGDRILELISAVVLLCTIKWYKKITKGKLLTIIFRMCILITDRQSVMAAGKMIFAWK